MFTSKLDIEVIVVDDKSPDGTAEICEQLQTVYPNRLRLLRRAGKLGLGSAYIEGAKLACGTHIILMDSDLSHHPRYIPEFIEYTLVTTQDEADRCGYRHRYPLQERKGRGGRLASEKAPDKPRGELPGRVPVGDDEHGPDRQLQVARVLTKTV